MSTTQFRTNRLVISAFLAGVASAPPAAASTFVLPIVAAAQGVNHAQWESEVRAINRTSGVRHLAVVDWVGTPDWRPTSYDVSPMSSLSIGGWGFAGGRSLGLPIAGFAVCEADDDLLVEAAILTGQWAGGGIPQPCASFNGGTDMCLGVVGAGPVLDRLQFTAPGGETFLPWLHTTFDRRTNIAFANPDATAAIVTVTMTSQDGSVIRTQTTMIPARTMVQWNDVFAQPPWSDLRAANGYFYAGATASIRADTRLIAIGYVISSDNGSLSISTPH